MKTLPGRDFPERGGVRLWLLLGLVLVVGMGAIWWVTFLPALVVSKIRERTGFAVEVQRMSLNPWTGRAAITGLVLRNPAGWPTEDFVELREFRATASLVSVFSGDRFIADEVVIDLPKLTLVRNEQGTLNALAFKDGLTGPAPATEPTKGKPPRGFLIRHLVLKFGKLVYADHAGVRPTVKEYHLNLDRDLREVDSIEKLVNPLSGLSPGLVVDTLGNLLRNRPDLLDGLAAPLQGAGKKTGEALKGILDSLDKKKP